MMRQYELVERIKAYDPGADEAALNRAYVFAIKAHGTQTRASGDPYFGHPVEVAGILTNYRLDTASIITALLHDTLEDTPVTLDELRVAFGAEIAQLVDGVTKLSKLELNNEQGSQAENFRKLVLAMSRDIRVLLVKLADRLHNMRTLSFIGDAERRRRIARETMEIYAPLAERIGMHAIKDELEDLAFGELNPEARDGIVKRLAFLRERGGDLVGRILAELRRVFAEADLVAEVAGREKAPYSIWRKMHTKNVAFEQLSDIMAFRVNVGSLADCYAALGAIHGRYRVVPGRFKDFISTPKPNGYQSLHTGVVGPEGHRIEVQIRSHAMHDVAERGVAAHWQYKQGAKPAEGSQYRWLQQLLEILESASGPEEFLEHTRLEMFQDQVFCFSPKGDVFALPRGATVIDFAYAVHSQIGDHCVGGKVNGRLVQLRTQLENGDQVEVLTSKNQTPSPEWEQIVITGKARSRIRRFIHNEQRRQYLSLGQSIIEKALRRDGHELNAKTLKPALAAHHCASAEDLYVKVGEGILTGRDVVAAAFPQPRETPSKPPPATGRARRTNKAKDERHAVPIKGLISGLAVHMARCCYPLPGDRIVGIIVTGRGVTIHTIDCDTLATFADEPERWLDVSWDEDDEAEHKPLARLKVVLSNTPGALSELTTVIAKNHGNITNLKITHRTLDFFDLLVDVEVRDRRHFTTMIAALRATSGINSVERARR